MKKTVILIAFLVLGLGAQAQKITTLPAVTSAADASLVIVRSGASGDVLSGITVSNIFKDRALLGTTTIATAINPDADDGATLGAPGTGWSGLYLAEDAVIIWGADDAILQNGTNNIILAEATLSLREALHLASSVVLESPDPDVTIDQTELSALDGVTGTLATTADIDDLIADAEVGIALADSTGYGSGNYLPRYSAEQLIASMGGGSGATGVSLATELQSLGASVKAIPIFCDMDASTSYTLLDSTIYVTAVYIPVAETITGVRFSLSTQGNYTADGNNRVGLYKVSGTTATLVASTANNGDLWKGDQYAWTNHAFSSSYNAEAGAYYIGFLYNYSAQTTAPAIYCGEAVALGSQSTFMGNSVRIRGTLANRSDLPSSFNMTWASTKTESPMIILY